MMVARQQTYRAGVSTLPPACRSVQTPTVRGRIESHRGGTRGGGPVDEINGGRGPAAGDASPAGPGSALDGPRMIALAHDLRIDRLTAEVVTGLEQGGLPSVLLKGPSLAALLYRGGLRAYGDVDLLVPRAERGRAEAVLRSIGFRRGQGGWMGLSCSWFRGEGETVDLHTSLFGVEAEPDVAWGTLSDATGLLRVGGREVRVLSEPALLMHVALHAAQHGDEHPKPLEDLRRAIAAADTEQWRAAAAVAQPLRALGAMSAGLHLVPEGACLADRLELPTAWSAAVSLHATPAGPLTKGFEQLAQLRPAQRPGYLLRTALPPPTYLRRWSGLARRGPIGLAGAYAGRPLWLLAHAPRGLVRWARIRRRAQSA